MALSEFAVLTESEIESLRFHLGYGNIAIDGDPYVGDGAHEVFNGILGLYLSVGAESFSETAVAAGETATVELLLEISGLNTNTRLVVDVGDAAETVIVKSFMGDTFTATFTKAHPASGWPIEVESGRTRLRGLLHQADLAWQKLQSANVTGSAGIKQLGNGEIEWFEGGQVFKQVHAHYKGIVRQLSRLVRVPCLDEENAISLEVY